MASQFDDSDFVDREYLNAQTGYTATAAGVAHRPPTTEELDSRASEAHQKLAELKRAQEELERERAALEDARRRRVEFQTGREEMLQHLIRGVALLEQAEFAARRDAEQMAKSLVGLHESLGRVQAIHDETWTQENWNLELSRALASIENARMEWNGARLKWPLLDGQEAESRPKEGASSAFGHWQTASFWEHCKLGVALTWPVAVVGLLGLILFLTLRLH
jgi:hypothetical protein